MPRLEVVHTPRWHVDGHRQPWHTRIIGANGEPLVSTETYGNEHSAYAVIQAIARVFGVDEPYVEVDEATGDGRLTGYVERSTLVIPILRVEVEA